MSDNISGFKSFFVPLALVRDESGYKVGFVENYLNFGRQVSVIRKGGDGRYVAHTELKESQSTLVKVLKIASYFLTFGILPILVLGLKASYRTKLRKEVVQLNKEALKPPKEEKKKSTLKTKLTSRPIEHALPTPRPVSSNVPSLREQDRDERHQSPPRSRPILRDVSRNGGDVEQSFPLSTLDRLSNSGLVEERVSGQTCQNVLRHRVVSPSDGPNSQTVQEVDEWDTSSGFESTSSTVETTTLTSSSNSVSSEELVSVSSGTAEMETGYGESFHNPYEMIFYYLDDARKQISSQTYSNQKSEASADQIWNLAIYLMFLKANLRSSCGEEALTWGGWFDVFDAKTASFYDAEGREQKISTPDTFSTTKKPLKPVTLFHTINHLSDEKKFKMYFHLVLGSLDFSIGKQEGDILSQINATRIALKERYPYRPTPNKIEYSPPLETITKMVYGVDFPKNDPKNEFSNIYDLIFDKLSKTVEILYQKRVINLDDLGGGSKYTNILKLVIIRVLKETKTSTVDEQMLWFTHNLSFRFGTLFKHINEKQLPEKSYRFPRHWVNDLTSFDDNGSPTLTDHVLRLANQIRGFDKKRYQELEKVILLGKGLYQFDKELNRLLNEVYRLFSGRFGNPYLMDLYNRYSKVEENHGKQDAFAPKKSVEVRRIPDDGYGKKFYQALKKEFEVRESKTVVGDCLLVAFLDAIGKTASMSAWDGRVSPEKRQAQGVQLLKFIKKYRGKIAKYISTNKSKFRKDVMGLPPKKGNKPYSKEELKTIRKDCWAFIVGENDTDKDAAIALKCEEIKRTDKRRPWLSAPEIEALANIVNRPIYVYTKGKGHFFLENGKVRPWAIYRSQYKGTKPVYLVYNGINHYKYLVPKVTQKKTSYPSFIR